MDVTPSTGIAREPGLKFLVMDVKFQTTPAGAHHAWGEKETTDAHLGSRKLELGGGGVAEAVSEVSNEQ